MYVSCMQKNNVEEEIYCRYEGEHSQKHLEGSRVDMTEPGHVSIGVGKQREPRAKRPEESEETKR